MYSENWVTWKTNVGSGTCTECLSRDKKIFSLDALIAKDEPPLHPNCRCERNPMSAMFAGEATTLGTNGADWWLTYLGELPDYYIHREDAKKVGWISWKGNLAEVLPGMMIFGGVFYNDEGILPQKEGRIWFEADINYTGGRRNAERLVFSNDGIVFVTRDHYKTFTEIIEKER